MAFSKLKVRGNEAETAVHGWGSCWGPTHRGLCAINANVTAAKRQVAS